MGLLLVRRERSSPAWRWRRALPGTGRSRLADSVLEAQLHQGTNEVHDKHPPAPLQLSQTEGLLYLEKRSRNVAHDLNNVLSIIFSHAELLEDGATNDQEKRHTIAIREAVLHGAESVRSLSRVWRPRAPRSTREGENSIR